MDDLLTGDEFTTDYPPQPPWAVAIQYQLAQILALVTPKLDITGTVTVTADGQPEPKAPGP